MGEEPAPLMLEEGAHGPAGEGQILPCARSPRSPVPSQTRTAQRQAYGGNSSSPPLNPGQRMTWSVPIWVAMHQGRGHPQVGGRAATQNPYQRRAGCGSQEGRQGSMAGRGLGRPEVRRATLSVVTSAGEAHREMASRIKKIVH